MVIYRKSTKFLLLVSLFCLYTLSALGNACLNPCTGSSTTGQDTTDRSNFASDNSALTFSNIVFDDATGTYNASSGLNASTAPGAQLYGVSFIGCLSGQSPCVSNSGLVDGTVGSWGGGSNAALTTSQIGYNPGNVATLTITLPANVMAIGFDVLFGNSVSSPTPFGVILDNGSTQNLMTATGVNLPGSVFFGYSSATAITDLTIFAQNTLAAHSSLGIDNFELGLAGAGGSGPVGGGGTSATPEASTLLMVSGGLFLLRFGRRWAR
ncbi:MAG: hypothetical protein JO307_26835 [Bryobacterales bacterium]|nr:hypothetical protein [Bryobacterales bacterium]MBV9398046.1 hypothetical protein [Bryobacterales bacterium]